MMLRSLVMLVPFACALPAAAQALEPLPVTYLPGGAVENGCRGQWQTNAAVRAHSAPTDVSAHTRTIDTLRRVDANDYSESVTAVLEAGRVRLTRALRVPAPPGSGAAGLQLAAGEEIRVLATSGAFTTFAYGGRIYEARLEGAEALQAPVTEVWVFLVPRDDRPAAWLNTAQAGVIASEPACGPGR